MRYRLEIVASEHNSPAGSVAISGTASLHLSFLALCASKIALADLRG